MQYIVRYWRIAADLPTSPERRWLARWAVAFAVLVGVLVGTYLTQAQQTLSNATAVQQKKQQLRDTDSDLPPATTPNTRAVAGPG